MVWVQSTSYANLISHYANLADKHDVESLMIGTELNSMQRSEYTQDWIEMISALREIYHGELTYSTSWNPHSIPGFVDHLDTLGISAYYPTRSLYKSDPNPEDFLYHLQEWRDEIRELQAALDTPLIMSEVGTIAVEGSARHPWFVAYTGENGLSTPDYEYQAAYYEAIQMLAEQEELGIIWWGPDFYDGERSDEERSLMTPIGKTAWANFVKYMDLDSWPKFLEQKYTKSELNMIR